MMDMATGRQLPNSIYAYMMKDIRGQNVALASYRGSVILVVNTASKCGFTPQFAGLEKLYQTYRDRGFVVLGFPCNQFGAQDPGSDTEIENFCRINYGVTFPMFARIEVNGAGEAPLYTWLKKQKKGLLGEQIKWNFSKFLIDRAGQVVDRFAPSTTPEQIAEEIEKLL